MYNVYVNILKIDIENLTQNLFMKKKSSRFLSQIVDKVKAALDTAVGILNDKEGWKVNLYLIYVV